MISYLSRQKIATRNLKNKKNETELVAISWREKKRQQIATRNSKKYD